MNDCLIAAIGKLDATAVQECLKGGSYQMFSLASRGAVLFQKCLTVHRLSAPVAEALHRKALAEKIPAS